LTSAALIVSAVGIIGGWISITAPTRASPAAAWPLLAGWLILSRGGVSTAASIFGLA
jgi:hypothetical protein